MALHSGEMVKAVMRDKGMTQAELANKIGKDQTLISRFLSGQVEISMDAALSIAEVLDIDFKELRRQLQLDKLERRQRHLRAEFKDVIDIGDEIDISSSNEPVHIIGGVGVEEIPDIIAIPLLDFIPLGDYDLSTEKSKPCIIPVSVELDAEKSFALKASGEGMTDDRIGEGDIIVIDPVAEIQDGHTILVVLGVEPAIGRIYRRGKTIVLQSSKEGAEPFILSQDDDFKVVGRVVMCIKFL